MLARSRGVPMVVGLGDGCDRDRRHRAARRRAWRHCARARPPPTSSDSARRRTTTATPRRAPTMSCIDAAAATKTARRSRCMVNIADPADVDAIDIAACDGVGLMRTEFLFGKASGLPDEETQYARLPQGAGMGGRQAGHHPHPRCRRRQAGAGLHGRGEQPVPRPARHPPVAGAARDVPRADPRAAARRAARQPEGDAADGRGAGRISIAPRALFDEEAAESGARGRAARMPPLGIMVEVPAVAIAPEAFAEAAFFSIGSNDLTQYVMAAARDNAAVAASQRPCGIRGAAADRVGRRIRQRARHAGQPCGDAGGDPAAIPALLEAGLRDLSVAPAQLAAGQGGDRRRRGLGERWHEPTVRTQAMPKRRSARYKTVLSARASTSARRARASGSPMRSASTAASSRRSPARPIRRRSRRSTCRPSSRSAISAPQERDLFLDAYQRAHPGKVQLARERPRVSRHLSLTVPDLGDDKQNAALDRAINEFIHRISSIAGKGGVTSTWEEPLKKLINAVDTVLTESLDGFAAAHADIRRARRRATNSSAAGS